MQNMTMRETMLKSFMDRTASALVAILVLVWSSVLGNAAEQTPEPKAPIQGKVLQTMNAGGYTYILVEHGAQKVWVAGREFKVAVGDKVSVPSGWTMKDFKSKTLDRTFDWIVFAPRVLVGDQAKTTPPSGLPAGHPALPSQAANSGLPAGHPNVGQPTVPQPARTARVPELKPGSINKAPGGVTVEQCYAQKSKLKNKTVKLRGVVVKYTPEILGVNWLHVRDGSGKPGSNDLVVTTKQQVKVGDTVLVTGKISYDKNLGAGYRFPAIIENAEVKVERQ